MSAEGPKSVKPAFLKKLGIQLATLLPVAGLVIYGLNAPGAVSPFLIVGAALLPAIVSFFNWRCPACNTYLGRNLLQFRCRGCDAGLLE